MSQVGTEGATTGVIHDQGYQRYTGTRRPQAKRFLVIAMNVLRSAWKQKWGVKAPLLLAAMAVVVGAGILVVRAQLGAKMPMFPPEQIMAGAVPFFTMAGFLLTVTVAVPQVADDLQAGAFYFYFARPIRPSDYVRGKLVGLLVLVGACTLLGPLALGLVRLTLVSSASEAWHVLPVVGQAFVLGVLATFALVLPAVACGALIGKRNAAVGAFIVYYTVAAPALEGVADLIDAPLLATLSVRYDIGVLTRYLFGRPPQEAINPAFCALALLVFSLGGYAAMSWRVRSAERAGVGGGS